MVVLKDVTLIVIDCFNYGGAVNALKKCISECEFASVKFLTDMDLEVEGVEVVKIPRINSKEEYSEFCIKELYKYFDTDFVMICQHDGYIINGSAWLEEFMEYDYVAPPWTYIDGKNVGCGGASLRSKKLQTALGTDEFIFASDPEDQAICRLYRDYLIKKYGIKFSPEPLADKFGYELRQPMCKTFCFHNYFHLPYKEHIVLRRTAAQGDVIMLEPLLSYYSEKGYQVVLDTLPQFMELFARYRHRIIHISAMDSRIKPIKSISFDMAYETKPKQLVLKSYVELTGEKIPLRNSIIDFPIDENAYLFKKYILIHVDDTGMGHRNCHGVKWGKVVSYYQKLGYLVFQIGKRMKDEIAPYLNTSNTETLFFMIKGASLLIGLDSSPLQIAVAVSTPAIGFFGSVFWEYRYLPTEKMIPIHSPCVKIEDDFCYHNEVGTTGVKCKYNEKIPPCTVYNYKTVIEAGNKLLNIN